MKRLVTAFRRLTRPGRFLARLVFPGRSQTEPAEGWLPLPPRRPAETRKVFLGHVKNALSGGGRR